MPDAQWQAEHSLEVEVAVAHAWNVWTDVSKWDDPPAQFVLNGPLVEGAVGRTLLAGQPPIQWTVRDVVQGQSATIVIDLDRATLAFIWRFDRLSERRTKLTQRIVLAGENAGTYLADVAAFGPGVPGGMKRIAEAMERTAPADR
jgi:hypothetical protein